MPEQFEQLNSQTDDSELGKIQPVDTEVPESIELTTKEDQELLDTLDQAKQAENHGDHEAAINLYNSYKESYQKFIDRQKQIELEKSGEGENRELEFFEELLAQGAKIEDVSKGLAGLDSPRAWKIREKIKTADIDNPGFYFARSLAGCNSERAWQEREGIVKTDQDRILLAWSLDGIDSERAWEIRRPWENAFYSWDVTRSIMGCDSEEAWNNRDKNISRHGSATGYVLESLAGLDDEHAWRLRNQHLTSRDHDSNIWELFNGLAGCTSDTAYTIREKYFSDESYKSFAAQSLTGIDDERAWKMRERLLVEGDKNSFTVSLAGCSSERAWEARKRLLKEGVDKTVLAQSIGNLQLVGVKAIRERETKR